MSKGTIRQILLITDGCSNQGEDPVRVSEHIAKQGISVNVIGVLEDDQTEDPTGLTEVNDIAEAGNGVSRIVYAEELSETVQMVTQQAITQTIQSYVSKELKDIFGKEVNEEELSPETKEEVHEIVEDLGETVDLQVLILIDTSASMQHKMSAVRESLNDLVISLRSRLGGYYFSIYHFPTRRQITKRLLSWTNEGAEIAKVFPKLATGGITPTGAALKEAVKMFDEEVIGEEPHYDIIDSSYRSSS
ncbi:VWA domain-containing protein [Allobacillus sp. GCM10007491]|uniref:VWA domain-containing protein n=1 Tax=Allobacillus saliphilus TaxID=2912308 RepID=A0A941CXN8_9BACI|nr:VWA domain-containing protein [Allobacillus saliphilus]MBR7554313.1 VWA domain-containing protein [Allobacillus saliphilus]